MKTKLFAVAAAAVASIGGANAVTMNVAFITNTGVGLVTQGASSTLVTGSVYLYSSSTDLQASQFSTFLADNEGNYKTAFETLIAADRVAIRGPIAFTNGAGTSPSTSSEVGAVGSFTYMLILSGDGKYVGVYQGAAVPAGGALTYNPATITDPNDLLGTSVAQSVGGVNSGFQLVTVPEPSVALLGALGVLGLVRRRR